MEESNLHIIRNSTMFSAFNDTELLNFPSMLRNIDLQQSESLFHQGQNFTHFYYVCDGVIKLSIFSESGNENVIEIVRQNQFFAEALVFKRSAYYPVQATAMKQSTLISIDASKYSSLLQNSIDACFRTLDVMSQRIHNLVGEIDNLTLHSSNSRLAGYLLQCLNYYPDKTLKLELPKGTIASRLSMKPETLSRALHSLEKSGIISINNRTIQVLKTKELERIAKEEVLTK